MVKKWVKLTTNGLVKLTQKLPKPKRWKWRKLRHKKVMRIYLEDPRRRLWDFKMNQGIYIRLNGNRSDMVGADRNAKNEDGH
tara:strand:- start:230 stop:475 length:246 start_codon:yes stop_codon:yes gene_type:complete